MEKEPLPPAPEGTPPEAPSPDTAVNPPRFSKVVRALLLLFYSSIALAIIIFILGISTICLAVSVNHQSREIHHLNKEIKRARHQTPPTYADLVIGAPDEIRGRIIIHMGKKNVRQGVPMIPLRIFRREAIDRALNDFAERNLTQPADFGQNRLSFPNPLEATITDINGFFSVKVPEPGKYVIYCTIRPSKNKPKIVWLLGVDTTDPLNTPVDLTDLNRLASFSKAVIVNEGR